MRLLVVDDEVDLAEAVATGLRREGHAVDVAHDGASALDALTVDEYDLVLLDITMPGEHDGLAVCRAIRDGVATGPMPRVLLLTARDTVDDRVIGLDAGADDYLVKPFAFRELERPGPDTAAPRRRPVGGRDRGRRPPAGHRPPGGDRATASRST